jgi:CHAD domain-containing protein
MPEVARSESVELRRACIGHLQASADLLSGATPSVRAIHAIRRHLKRADALWQLLGSAEAEYKPVRKALRSVRRALGPIRDQDVDRLEMNKLAVAARLKAADRRRIEVQMSLHRPQGAILPEHLTLVSRLRAAKILIERQLCSASPRSASAGVSALYSRAARAFRNARRSTSDFTLHVLRRRAKALCYALQHYRSGLSPGQRRLMRRLERLGHLLGQYRDLARLEVRLSDLALTSASSKKLQHQVHAELAEAEEQTLRLAGRALRRRRRKFRRIK